MMKDLAEGTIPGVTTGPNVPLFQAASVNIDPLAEASELRSSAGLKPTNDPNDNPLSVLNEIRTETM